MFNVTACSSIYNLVPQFLTLLIFLLHLKNKKKLHVSLPFNYLNHFLTTFYTSPLEYFNSRPLLRQKIRMKKKFFSAFGRKKFVLLDCRNFKNLSYRADFEPICPTRPRPARQTPLYLCFIFFALSAQNKEGGL